MALDRFEAPAHGVEGVAGRDHQSGIQATRKLGWTRRPGKAASSATTSNRCLARKRTPPASTGFVVRLESSYASLVTQKMPTVRVMPMLAYGVTLPGWKSNR